MIKFFFENGVTMEDILWCPKTKICGANNNLFINAVIRGSLNMVKFFVEKGVPESEGNTAVRLALIDKNVEILRFLLSAGYKCEFLTCTLGENIV